MLLAANCAIAPFAAPSTDRVQPWRLTSLLICAVRRLPRRAQALVLLLPYLSLGPPRNFRAGLRTDALLRRRVHLLLERFQAVFDRRAARERREFVFECLAALLIGRVQPGIRACIR